MEIDNYKQLMFFIDFFKSGNSNIILHSRAGLGKSFAVDAALKDVPHGMISGHATPRAIYLEAYKCQDMPIVIRDIGALLYNTDSISLLIQLTESRETKEIKWLSTAKLNHNDELIPSSFNTSSTVLIETNDLNQLIKRIEPLFSRMWSVTFNPNIDEVIAKLQEIKQYYGYEGDIVFNFIKKHSKDCLNIDLRLLTKGIALYKHTKGSGWEELLLKEMQAHEKVVRIRNLLESFDSDKDRLVNWPYSRASYYAYKKKVLV